MAGAALKHLPLPAAFGERPDGTTWITCGCGDDVTAFMFEGPPNRDAAAELVRALNAYPAAAEALKAVRANLRDPDANCVLPNATAEKVGLALAAMGERS